MKEITRFTAFAALAGAALIIAAGCGDTFEAPPSPDAGTIGDVGFGDAGPSGPSLTDAGSARAPDGGESVDADGGSDDRGERPAMPPYPDYADVGCSAVATSCSGTAPYFVEDVDSQLSPDIGTPPDRIALCGCNFDQGDPRVFFDGVRAVLEAPPTANELIVVLPPQPSGMVPVTVETDFGTAVADRAFTYLHGGGELPTFEPSGLQIEPSTVRPEEIVTIRGANLDTVYRVTIHSGEPLEVLTATAETVEVRVPARFLEGVYRLYVDNAAGYAWTDDVLTVATPANAPQLDTDPFDPGLGRVGDRVTLRGRHFDAPGLTVNALEQTAEGRTFWLPIEASSATTVTVRLPPELPVRRTYRFEVRTEAGRAITGTTFGVVD